MTSTVTLTPQQEERARELLQQISTDSQPYQFLEIWEPTPSTVGLTANSTNLEYVPVADIKGTEEHNINRLEATRLRKIVKLLLDGKFEREHRFPPVLCEINGEYYVDGDGTHRVIAHKYIGIKSIYAEVLEYQ